jgi:CRISPR/Cas system-associated exonuclease Cas4 (RecB family)
MGTRLRSQTRRCKQIMENYIDILREALKVLASNCKTGSITDLTKCHRQKVFSIIDPIPKTEEELYDIISGEAAHYVIEKLFEVIADRFRSEQIIEYKNVRGKIDIYDKLHDTVIEIKNSNSSRILKPFKFHQEQIKYYMAIKGSDEGRIIYLINKMTDSKAFQIHMTEEQRKMQLEKLESEAKSIGNAMDAHDPSVAKAIYQDAEMEWMCNRCPYLEKCIAVRSSDREKEAYSNW